jgi:hypothetical protein
LKEILSSPCITDTEAGYSKDESLESCKEAALLRRRIWGFWNATWLCSDLLVAALEEWSGIGWDELNGIGSWDGCGVLEERWC